MNHMRMQSIERGLNGTARKVLDAIGWGDEKTLHEISTTLQRSGVTYTVAAITGSLKHMEEQGLLRARGGGWIRERASGVKPAPASTPTAAPETPIAPPSFVATLDPVGQLAELAKKLRSAAATFAAAANEAEEIALQLEEQLGKESAELRKLRELRDVLKGL